MKIAIGCDHGGYLLKKSLIGYLKQKGHNMLDVGCYTIKDCDYPEFGLRVSNLVAEKKADMGILICKSGIGYSIVANKIKGIRAALCYNIDLAKLSRQHNDANVLILGALYTSTPKAKQIASVWLKTKFLRGRRHTRRIKQLSRIERKIYK